MAKTYEEYLREMMKQAREKQAAYEVSRRGQADEMATLVDDAYDAARQQAEKLYAQTVKDTEDSFRHVFDANAVDELVARRDAAEAIARLNLSNSGLNHTQQTAISLQRSRADSQTRTKRQQAVKVIMQKLDELRGQYDREATAKKADIYASRDSDIQQHGSVLNAAARQNATSLYHAEQERLALEHAVEQERLAMEEAAEQERLAMEEAAEQQRRQAQATAYKIASMNHNIPSITAVKTQAELYAREDVQRAIDYLDRQYVVGYIGEAQYTALADPYKQELSWARKQAVKNAILTKEQARYSGELNIYRTYPAYVVSVITNALLNQRLNGEEASDLVIELEARWGLDLGPYVPFGKEK